MARETARRAAWLVLAALGALAALAAAAGLIFIYSGAYNVAATSPHSGPAYWLLQTVRDNSVARRAADVAVPPLGDATTIEKGLGLYRQNCQQCHGGPAVAPEAFAMGLEPPAPNLAQTGREWTPAEIYWAVKNGIKMTGMPAWDHRLADADIWAVVAFVHHLPNLSPSDYRAMAARAKLALPSAELQPSSEDARRGTLERGEIAIHQYACVSCHTIPGVTGPDSTAGTPLDGIASRAYIAGVLLNTPENLVRWIREPQHVDPLTAMPDMGVSESDARDIAAYLLTLR
jgi:mono/diheme cytochrome c family protein